MFAAKKVGRADHALAGEIEYGAIAQIGRIRLNC
jgi:hypothetical protein